MKRFRQLFIAAMVAVVTCAGLARAQKPATSMSAWETVQVTEVSSIARKRCSEVEGADCEKFAARAKLRFVKKLQDCNGGSVEKCDAANCRKCIVEAITTTNEFAQESFPRITKLLEQGKTPGVQAGSFVGSGSGTGDSSLGLPPADAGRAGKSKKEAAPQREAAPESTPKQRDDSQPSAENERRKPRRVYIPNAELDDRVKRKAKDAIKQSLSVSDGDVKSGNARDDRQRCSVESDALSRDDALTVLHAMQRLGFVCDENIVAPTPRNAKQGYVVLWLTKTMAQVDAPQQYAVDAPPPQVAPEPSIPAAAPSPPPVAERREAPPPAYVPPPTRAPDARRAVPPPPPPVPEKQYRKVDWGDSLSFVRDNPKVFGYLVHALTLEVPVGFGLMATPQTRTVTPFADGVMPSARLTFDQEYGSTSLVLGLMPNLTPWSDHVLDGTVVPLGGSARFRIEAVGKLFRSPWPFNDWLTESWFADHFYIGWYGDVLYMQSMLYSDGLSSLKIWGRQFGAMSTGPAVRLDVNDWIGISAHAGPALGAMYARDTHWSSTTFGAFGVEGSAQVFFRLPDLTNKFATIGR